MKAYKIQTPYNYSQPHIVVADDMGKAEKIFLSEYPNTKILEIELVAEYVQVQTSKKG